MHRNWSYFDKCIVVTTMAYTVFTVLYSVYGVFILGLLWGGGNFRPQSLKFSQTFLTF